MTSVQFLEFVLSLSVQATLVIWVTHALCQLVTAPRSQCQLWHSCHVLLLLLIACGLVLPHWRVLSPWEALSTTSIEQAHVLTTTVGQATLTIWGIGFTVSLLSLFWEWVRAFRFLSTCREATPEQTNHIQGFESTLATVQDTSQSPPYRLLVSETIGSPFCTQWHRPTLVIPQFLLDLPRDEFCLIMRHELEHLKSGHPLQLFLERLTATVFWFHPAVWWAGRQAALVREYTCDDAAANDRREIVRYLKVLLAIAERGLHDDSTGAALFLGRNASLLALRGRRLLQKCEALPETKTRDTNPTLWPQITLVIGAIAVWFLWAPLDVLASSRSHWSPWPRWSATVLRTFEIPASDREPYDIRTRIYELSEHRSRLEKRFERL